MPVEDGGWDPRTVAVAAGVWLAVVGAAGAGAVSLSLIDEIVLFGVAVVLPLAVGGPVWWWEAAAVSALVSFPVSDGRAGVFAVPAVMAALGVLARRLLAARPWEWRGIGDLGGADGVVGLVAPAWAVVATVFLFQSRCGLELLGIHEPIVELTAVHYVFAGAAALVLAGSARREASGGWRRVGLVAVLLTAAAPPIVAFGFVSGYAFPQVGGAVLMTLGVWSTATLELRAAAGARPPVVRVLLGLSGLAIWVPMVLAVAWASGQHWNVPALSIPDMARTHGVANAFVFVLGGLLARHAQQRNVL